VLQKTTVSIGAAVLSKTNVSSSATAEQLRERKFSMTYVESCRLTPSSNSELSPTKHSMSVWHSVRQSHQMCLKTKLENTV